LFSLFGKEGSPKNHRFFGVLEVVRGDFKEKTSSSNPPSSPTRGGGFIE